MIINSESFADIDEPTKKELKLDDPQYKYINAAIYFYKKLCTNTLILIINSYCYVI